MTRNVLFGAIASTLVMLAACSQPANPPAVEETVDAEAGAAVETGAALDEAMIENAEAESAAPDLSQLTNVLAGDWRQAEAGRDASRHPAETLEFFGIDPTSTVIEIWPGSGWYTDVLAPWIAANGGQYVAGHFSMSSDSTTRRNARAAFEAHIADHELFGNIRTVDFGQNSGDLVEPGTADAVLTFRNVHNWMMFGYAEKAFDDFYTALRPGGILGVVDHRLPSTREQDPQASSGYVQQDYVIALAREAGFEFVDSSEINANPADTADHPFGVWTLPPVRESAASGQPMDPEFDRAYYDSIGESDRMTLLFRKPLQGDAPAEAEENGQ